MCILNDLCVSISRLHWYCSISSNEAKVSLQTLEYECRFIHINSIQYRYEWTERFWCKTLCSGGDAHALYKVNYESLCMNNMIWSQVFSSLTLILLVVCFFSHPAHPIRIKLNVIVYISSFRDVPWLRICILDICSWLLLRAMRTHFYFALFLALSLKI